MLLFRGITTPHSKNKSSSTAMIIPTVPICKLSVITLTYFFIAMYTTNATTATTSIIIM
jgi:hypothetical protein